ncbi:MAG TPA: hypothetical protein VJZ69_01010, partial [Clostridia bacterium]|nr:hypothetical protein [Clostridia bacterium]
MSAPVKRNSGCRSFFIFVLGMITGVIVFLGAIAGTVYVIVSSYTLKDVESTLNVDIPLDNEEIMNKTLLDLGKDLYTTLSNITTITVQQLMDKYGLPIPADLYGIDISPLFGYSITEMPNHMNEVLDSVTLAKVGSIAGIDFGSYNLPILTKSIDLPVMQAFDGLMRSFGGDMTMRSLNTNFGINLAG